MIEIMIILNQIFGALVMFALLRKRLKAAAQPPIIPEVVIEYERINQGLKRTISRSQDDLFNLTQSCKRLEKKLTEYLGFESMYQDYEDFTYSGKVSEGRGGIKGSNKNTQTAAPQHEEPTEQKKPTEPKPPNGGLNG